MMPVKMLYHFYNSFKKKSFPDSDGSRKVEFIAEGWCTDEIIHVCNVVNIGINVTKIHS